MDGSALNSCSELPPRYPSGVYQGVTTEDKMYSFFCYFDLNGGKWMVIQRRLSRVVDFHRSWNEYKKGFGELDGNFWIGNDFLHLVTNPPRILRIEVEFVDGTKGYAQYANFQVANEDQKYKLALNGFTGNLSDSVSHVDGAYFSTRDVDSDENPHGSCSDDYGGWTFWKLLVATYLSSTRYAMKYFQIGFSIEKLEKGNSPKR
ncbi:ficolin-1-like [Pecten maximus]|uniref:ficolin-1-like n=1 Tax=Pecten maximus TaxID=6579 RepID=UPI00145838AA|nr:ficolin-1-like [Pecten maximus]